MDLEQLETSLPVEDGSVFISDLHLGDCASGSAASAGASYQRQPVGGAGAQTAGNQPVGFHPEIAIDSVDLPEPMHEDPSNRILVATARIERLTLLTRDRDILAFAKATKLACMQA